MNKKKLYLGVAITAVSLAGASYFGTSFFHQGKTQVQAMTIQNKTAPAAQISVQSLSKQDIQRKMLDSIDNFDKADGSFTYHSDSAGYEYVVDYSVKTKKNEYKSYVKMTSANDSREVSYDGKDTVDMVNHKDKTFKHLMVAKPQDESAKFKDENPQDRYSKNDKGQKVYERRSDPTFMDMAALSLFPEDFALGFLEDYNKWDIISDNEKLEGLDVVVIGGDLDSYYQEKHHAKSFKLWVDKNTGIVVQMEEYNENGVATEFLRTNSIKLNDETKNVSKVQVPNDYKQLKF